MFFMDVDTIFGVGRRYKGLIMKKKRIIGLIALLLAASVACTACGSSVNMHKHSRLASPSLLPPLRGLRCDNIPAFRGLTPPAIRCRPLRGLLPCPLSPGVCAAAGIAKGNIIRTSNIANVRIFIRLIPFLYYSPLFYQDAKIHFS